MERHPLTALLRALWHGHYQHQKRGKMRTRSDAAVAAQEHAETAEALNRTLLGAVTGDTACIEIAPVAAERFPREIALAQVWSQIAEAMRP